MLSVKYCKHVKKKNASIIAGTDITLLEGIVLGHSIFT